MRCTCALSTERSLLSTERSTAKRPQPLFEDGDPMRVDEEETVEDPACLKNNHKLLLLGLHLTSSTMRSSLWQILLQPIRGTSESELTHALTFVLQIVLWLGSPGGLQCSC